VGLYRTLHYIAMIVAR